MRKSLLTMMGLALSLSYNAQYLTYVGSGAVMTVNDGALVYNGGGLRVASTAKVDNMGDMMIVGGDNDKVQFEEESHFVLTFGKQVSTDANPGSKKNVYGQLYISGIPQSGITGKLKKQYMADNNHSETGRQQLALPFHEITLGEVNKTLGDYLNTTDASLTYRGRWSKNSVFKWNNSRSRFDQIIGENTHMGKPTEYYILPRRRSDGSISWNAIEDLKIFEGTPISDKENKTMSVNMEVSTIPSFGGGWAMNIYRERYRTYLHDPFETEKWSENYGKRMHHFGNPFLTNLDLFHFSNMGLSNVVGIAYAGSGSFSWNPSGGTSYDNIPTIVVAKTVNGMFQVGDLGKLMIKPFGAVNIKFSDDAPKTANFNPARKFAQEANQTSSSAGVTGRLEMKSIPADKFVRQLAVIAYDAQNVEIGRTYYAVSPSMVTGFSQDAQSQSIFDESLIFTKEELAEGGEDVNITNKYYINEANETNFKGKKLPMYVDERVKSLGFEIYEGGKKVNHLTNGEFFYISNEDNVITKIKVEDKLPVSVASFGLHYGMPTDGVLASKDVHSDRTVVAKKGNDWVARFDKSWKSAKVEIYSATGQLIYINQHVSTSSDYILPLKNQVNTLYLVKLTSDTGEVVIKKIVK